MKKLAVVIIVLLTVMLCSAAIAADGRLTICSPNSDGLLSVIPLFEERTGIHVTLDSLGTGECLKHIRDHQEAPEYDLMYGGTLANFVVNADLFQEYYSSEDEFLMEPFKNTLGFCSGYTIDGSVLLVNDRLLDELGVTVSGYADLLQPALWGRIISADPRTSSSAFCQLTNILLVMGGYENESAWLYAEDLFRGQNVYIALSSSDVYNRVCSGEFAIGLTYEDPCITLIREGASGLRIVYPAEGTVFLPAQIGIVRNTEHAEEARQFIDFMLSEEAQRYLAEMTTSRNIRNVDYVNELVPPLSDLNIAFEDSAYVISHTDEIRERIGYIIGQ